MSGSPSAVIRLVLLAAIPVVLQAGCTAAPKPGTVSSGSQIIPPDSPIAAPACGCANSDPRRARVHFFVINGLDPIGFGGLNRVLCNNIRQAGFTVHFGEVWDQLSFKKEIVAIRKADPEARIVLLGYSRGANIVRRMSKCLDGIERVDLLVYLGGDTIYDREWNRPANVAKIVNIRAHGFPLTGGPLVEGDDLTGADNYYLDVPHLKAPVVPETTGILLQELRLLAAAIPS